VTDYTALRGDIVRLGESFNAVTRAQISFNDLTTADSKNVWEAVAELRDEIHALSNRIEQITRAMFMEPSEVANVERLRRDVSE